MNIGIVLEKSPEGGYTAVVPSLPGCISEGGSREEALRRIREAVERYLERIEDDDVFAANSEMIEMVI
ncbi:MAG: type II toxin-antitoxin system HicB family antitoxin [Deltaproteobacteria bacterium]|nr:type II toxin-antitoxin system HicB family antitoxin [Deltaproteobacteria bacterium]